MLNLDSNIQFIKGVGEKRAKLLFIFTQENMRIGLSAKP